MRVTSPQSRCSNKPYQEFSAVIEDFRLDPKHRETRTWMDHENINEVCLACSLLDTRKLQAFL